MAHQHREHQRSGCEGEGSERRDRLDWPAEDRVAGGSAPLQPEPRGCGDEQDGGDHLEGLAELGMLLGLTHSVGEGFAGVDRREGAQRASGEGAHHEPPERGTPPGHKDDRHEAQGAERQDHDGGVHDQRVEGEPSDGVEEVGRCDGVRQHLRIQPLFWPGVARGGIS